MAQKKYKYISRKKAMLVVTIFGICLMIAFIGGGVGIAYGISQLLKVDPAELYDQEVEYYSNDDNYQYLEGQVKIIDRKENTLTIGITKDFDGVTYDEQHIRYANFKFYVNTHLLSNINGGDIITFMSVPRDVIGYGILPIFYFSIDNYVYLTFREGKRDFLYFLWTEYDAKYPSTSSLNNLNIQYINKTDSYIS